MTTYRKEAMSIVLFLALAGVAFAKSKTVLIVNEQRADTVLNEAALRLQTYAGKTYDAVEFVLTDALIEGLQQIQLVVDPQQDSDAYRIRVRPGVCVVSGGSARGVMYAVTDMLEQMGWQFYLSYELAPATALAWDLHRFETENRPLVGRRIIFNWHNFLSGCTGWDYEQWRQWVEQASKMKFNTIMVHAYANNPMNPFSFNGQHKDLGYLTTTQHGRDWGAQHISDARRLHGGVLFDGAVFGAQAAQVEESHKSRAAVALMQKVFRYAARLGMDVCFAIDTDTWMANPQNIIRTLPAEALLTLGEHRVVNPEHPAGYPYYRAQIETLLTLYPEITQVAFWSRRPSVKPGNGSIWLGMTRESMPVAWWHEYQAIMQDHPEVDDNARTLGVFAVSKIAVAFDKSIQELRPDVELCYGSWGLDYTVLGDLFFPPSYGMIPLDYSIVLDNADKIAMLKRVGKNRTLYPIVWAHHDDHRYNGRPYMPFANFHSLLQILDAEGFGIIHWKTHPLDLYFQNKARQVWQQTENESYGETVLDLARGLAVSQDKAWENYLERWYTESPMFGRETSDYFLRLDHDYSIDGYASALEVVAKAEQRLALLDQVDPGHLSDRGQQAHAYHRAMEQFTVSFFTNHHHAHQATRLLKQGQLAKAMAHARQTDPAGSIRMYAELIEANGPTRGELGIVVSLNLRWLPDFVDLYQRLRMEPVRISVQPTSHDPLSQGTGRFSYLMDADQKLWLAQGVEELGLAPIVSKAGSLSSPRDAYLVIDEKVTIPLRTLRQKPIPQGRYQWTLLTPQEKPNCDSVRVWFKDEDKTLYSEIFSLAQWSNRGGWTFDLELSGKDVMMSIEPHGGSLSLAGMEATPQ